MFSEVYLSIRGLGRPRIPYEINIKSINSLTSWTPAGIIICNLPDLGLGNMLMRVEFEAPSPPGQDLSFNAEIQT